MLRTPAPRIARLPALAACAAALLLLALAAGAQARKSACSSSAAHRASRGAPACAQSRHSRRKPPVKHAKKHARHAAKHVKRPTGPARREAPSCEDGSNALAPAGAAGAGGAPVCADGSEPQCALGSTPTFASDGSLLYCTPSREAGSTFGEGGAPEAALASCKDGTLANGNGEGAYVCDDASEPHCPAGYVLTLTESGDALACDPQSEEA
jgi:hypothetical protein